MPTPLRLQPISLLAGKLPLAALLMASGHWTQSAAARRILAGEVAVNGRAVRQPHQRVHPWQDAVAIAGEPLPPLRPCRYVLLFKPYHALSDWGDPEGRTTLSDYVPLGGLSVVGRLDYDSEGLILLTDDGWLNHRLTHPHWEHPKTYVVQVEGLPSEQALATLRAGVLIRGERTLPAEVKRLAFEALPNLPARPAPVQAPAGATSWLRIILREGAKRQIRHMTAAVGHPTLRLVRIAIGPLQVGALQPGQWRDLTPLELQALAASVGGDVDAQDGA